MKPVAVMIAAWSPDEDGRGLGAGQKIQLVIRALDRLGYAVHLVDSSHELAEFRWPQRDLQARVGEVNVRLWRPIRLPVRFWGKCLNWLWLHDFPARLRRLRPALVWVYNSYAYESRLALRLQQDDTRLILELEDLPQARSRGLNPKPWLDERYLLPLLKRSFAATFVNAQLMKRYGGLTRRPLLLPSILDEDLRSLPTRLRFSGSHTIVGYFGGLEVEKGARVLLESVPELPADVQMIVTGHGSLSGEFSRLAKEFPNSLTFHGSVPRARLVELMGGCDVILNPHTPIDSMADGVFPFKVFEGIATGALVISTALPPVDRDLRGAVLPFDGSVKGLLSTIQDSAKFYCEQAGARNRVCASVWEDYGFSGFCERIRTAVELNEERS